MTDTGKLYWSAIETFGEDLQIAVTIEEMAELTKELCKAQRVTFAGRGGLGDGLIDNYDEIAEEIADVQIALEELMLLFGVPVEVQIARRQKLARLEMRIEKAREARGDNREHTAHWEDPGQKGDLRYAKLNGPGPDPKGARGAWGHCPKCGAVGYCYWDKEEDTCTCMACGYKD
jgi:NTP pyrophosphatase (non-canonical NTP hydrolase)